MYNQPTISKREERRKRKALRSYRWRPFKNFLWWLTGIISGIVILVGTIVAAFTLVPIDTYLSGDNEGIVSDEIAGSTILDLIMNIDKYKTSDIPLIKQLLYENVTEGEAGEYIEIDYDKLDNLSFTALETGLMDCIRIVATLDNLGVSDMLGDLATLKTLTQFIEVEETVDTQASNFNPKIYYYDKNEVVAEGGASPMSGIYQGQKCLFRAFDDVGNRIAPINATLYYGALTKMPLLDAFESLGETFGRIEINELIEMSEGESSNEENDDNFINKIFDGKKISELDTISTEDIKLVDVLSGIEEDDIYKILSSATGKVWNEITIYDLENGLNIDDVTLETFLGEENQDNEELYEILRATSGKAEGEDLLVSDLKGDINFDDVKLDTILKRENDNHEPINVKMWDILDMSVTDLDGDGIEVSELDNFQYDNILLNKVMPYDSDDTDGKSNDTLYSVLLDVTGKTHEHITLGDLDNFDTANIKINTVVPKTENNKELYDILIDLTDESDYTKITLGSLDDFAINDLHLQTVLGESMDQTLKNLLCEAVGKTNDQFGDILVGDISGEDFDIGQVKLSTVMTKNNGSYGNAILDSLLKDTVNPVTISNVGSRITGLRLYDVYGTECFKLAGEQGATFVDNDVWFAKEKVDTDGDGEVDHDAFVHKDAQYWEDNPSAEKYGLCANDGIWLLLCFDSSHSVFVNGRPESYVVSDFTVGDFENGTAKISSVFKNATIQQLIDSGIIPDAEGGYNSKLYTLTLVEAVKELSDMFDAVSP